MPLDRRAGPDVSSLDGSRPTTSAAFLRHPSGQVASQNSQVFTFLKSNIMKHGWNSLLMSLNLDEKSQGSSRTRRSAQCQRLSPLAVPFEYELAGTRSS